jgi:hypothetical protein
MIFFIDEDSALGVNGEEIVTLRSLQIYTKHRPCHWKAEPDTIPDGERVRA